MLEIKLQKKKEESYGRPVEERGRVQKKTVLQQVELLSVEIAQLCSVTNYL